jgi:hypothetical protein
MNWEGAEEGGRERKREKGEGRRWVVQVVSILHVIVTLSPHARLRRRKASKSRGLPGLQLEGIEQWEDLLIFESCVCRIPVHVFARLGRLSPFLLFFWVFNLFYPFSCTMSAYRPREMKDKGLPAKKAWGGAGAG